MDALLGIFESKLLNSHFCVCMSCHTIKTNFKILHLKFVHFKTASDSAKITYSTVSQTQ